MIGPFACLPVREATLAIVPREWQNAPSVADERAP